ncbi:MAG TPA: hypothetical protein V6C89_08545 [Drouetiella sp.]|jgi:hypothetical protein
MIKTVWKITTATLFLGMLVASNSYAAENPITAAEVQNAEGCLPSLADPPDEMVKFKDGKFSSKDYPFAKIRATAFGVLDGSPAAVAEVCWNTGGSGNWEVVELFRKKNGHVVGDKVYCPRNLPEGGTMVGRIEIKNNKIYLYGEAPMENDRKIKTPLIISTRQFTPYRK